MCVRQYHLQFQKLLINLSHLTLLRPTPGRVISFFHMFGTMPLKLSKILFGHTTEHFWLYFYRNHKDELEEIIHPCGFYKNKAKNARACANKILDNFNGIVPNTMEELITLPGVGRKSANVILLEVFGIANGIAVDTHAKRISNRIGLSSEKEPEKIEQDLLKVFPKEYLKDINHLFVWHGRKTCMARTPNCKDCTVKDFCKKYKLENKS